MRRMSFDEWDLTSTSYDCCVDHRWIMLTSSSSFAVEIFPCPPQPLVFTDQSGREGRTFTIKLSLPFRSYAHKHKSPKREKSVVSCLFETLLLVRKTRNFTCLEYPRRRGDQPTFNLYIIHNFCRNSSTVQNIESNFAGHWGSNKHLMSASSDWVMKKEVLEFQKPLADVERKFCCPLLLNIPHKWWKW